MKSILSLLNNTFTIWRKARTSDGAGGWAESLVSQGDVLGRLRPATSTERLVADQVQAQISHVLYVLAGTDVQRGDTVTGAGTELRVVAVREPSYASEHLEVDCLATQREPQETGS